MADCVLEIEKNGVFHMTGLDRTYIAGWISDECIIGNDIKEFWSLYKGEEKIAELEVNGFVSTGLPEQNSGKQRVTLSITGHVDKKLFDFKDNMILVRDISC